jgi:PhoPQ-activated pathogenicity-related protein
MEAYWNYVLQFGLDIRPDKMAFDTSAPRYRKEETAMLLEIRVRIVLALCAFAIAGLTATPSSADLQKYVSKPEPSFEWQVKNKIEQSGDGIYDLQFVSQVWQSKKWQHQLQIYRPAETAPSSTMFLWVTGGAATPQSVSLGMDLARKIKAPVAFVYHIPNQPLLEGNLREDDLIAETFVRYLKSRDESWPLLLPMVKSVVKAMDVLQAFGKKEWNSSMDKFIVAGASKRGWTTWLTAAVDKRVGAIAPVVIDVLNMRAQMSRQVQTLGAYSSRLTPYSSRGLLPIPETPAGRRLLNMVDPWAYRDRLTMPKLIVNGTNDFYWATDALNLYWDGIPNNKWVLYIPNAGHNLRRQDRPQREQLNDLVTNLAAFSRHQINRTPMPRLGWKHENVNGKLRLTIDANSAPTGARLWIAQSATTDFRSSQWREQEMTISGGKVIGDVTPPEKGHLAFFGELTYEIDGLHYQLSTQVRTTE